MKIINKDNGKICELTIIDPGSGCEWTQDLLGECLVYDDDIPKMGHEDILWWSNIIDGLNRIEKLKMEAERLLSYEEYNKLESELQEIGNSEDYEEHIRVLTDVLSEVIRSAENPL